MASLGPLVVDIPIEPSDKLKELIRSFVRQELAGEFSDLVKDIQPEAMQEHIRTLVRDEVAIILNDHKTFARMIAPAIAEEITRLVRLQGKPQ